MISTRTRLAILGLPFAPVAALAARPLRALAVPDEDNPFIAVPVRGSGEENSTFRGLITIRRFAADGDDLLATADLTGTVTRGDGSEEDITPTTATFVVARIEAQGKKRNGRGASSEAVCRILDLDLGPLDLNLLGLRIQLNRVELDVTAIPGGGLLGDLLCALANLLNGGGALARIARTLNRILRELRA